MKPIILTFTSFYIPGFRGGGPIRTIENMVAQLGKDFEFRIVTSDRDLGDLESYQNIKVDAWNDVGNAKVFYASPASRSFLGFIRIIQGTPHDLIYLNSFFNILFALFPIFARWVGLAPFRPLIIAPRGEFSSGALSIKSWKKKPFIMFARALRLFNGVTWHASTDLEMADIQRVFPALKNGVYVASNISVAPDSVRTVPCLLESATSDSLISRSLHICFLSRIVPMKNLEYALTILMNVKAPITFNIFGPKEDPVYWDKCQVIIDALPKNIAVNYHGSVAHAEVQKTIGAHDVFFVPSRGENYGHVFMESLFAGVPILVSDQTPWRSLTHHGIGWDIPLNQPEAFVEAIEEAAGFDNVKRHQVKLDCLGFARKRSLESSSVELNRTLFVKALTPSN